MPVPMGNITACVCYPMGSAWTPPESFKILSRSGPPQGRCLAAGSEQGGSEFILAFL